MKSKGHKKVSKKTASDGKKGAAKPQGPKEDMLGEALGDEEVSGIEDSDSNAEIEEDEADALSDGAGSDAGAPPGAAAGGPGDQDDAAEYSSKLLAKVAAGEQVDLSALKERIHNDATLLGSWRKAKQLGDQRSREEVFRALVGNCSTYFGYSEELAEYFLQMFSAEQAVQFFEANEQSRPITIRTNSLKARRSSLMQSLSARKMNVDPVGEWSKVGLKVYDSAVPVGATPEYLGGHYMIQSASSFIPVMALAPQQNEKVLDMAAAPGGKTTYIGQLMRNTGTLFANDLRAERCKSLVANVHRMGLTNVVVSNLDGKKLMGMLPRLDRVLLDAPCTGSGIIARDPSVKVKRGQKDFEDHSRLQKELLMTAIDMVDAKSKTGGYIVYSTCSCSVEENEAVIDHALRVRSVELVSFSGSVNFGVEGMTKYRERRFHPTMGLCRRYYPHVHNMDGFFVAKLKKTSNTIPERVKKDRSKGADHVKTWGEEHWTNDVLDAVMDFTPPAPSGGAAAQPPQNKRDRKRLKREAQLQARQREAQRAAAAAASAAAPGESAQGAPAKEPEEEPKPSKAKGKKRRREAEEGGAPEAPAPSKATGLKKKKKRRQEEDEADRKSVV